MKKIVDSLSRLFSVRNLIAIAIAFFFEVLVIYGLTWLIFALLNFFFSDGPNFHWVINEKLLNGIVRYLFIVQMVIATFCHLKIEFGSKKPGLERWLNIVITIIMWPGFAIMLFTYIPTMGLVILLRRNAKNNPRAWFFIFVIYKSIF